MNWDWGLEIVLGRSEFRIKDLDCQLEIWTGDWDLRVEFVF